MAETVMQQCKGTVSATNIKKALSIFMKASLFKLDEHKNNEDQDKKWKVIQKSDFLLDVDKAIIERLLSSIEENKSKVYWSVVLNVLYSSYSEKEIKKLISEIQRKKAES
jgi:Glu-tRNA(Gln) amidotransferase subunit E-like FAD-binding protein